MDFKTLQEKLIDFGRNNDACSSGINGLKNAESVADLLKVVTDNFNWVAIRTSVADLLRGVSVDDLSKANIYINGAHSVSNGVSYACGSAIVYASSIAIVHACGSSTVYASGSATVLAWDSATVYASGNATMMAWDSSTVYASGSATVDASGIATVYASGIATVYACDSATVKAWGSSAACVLKYA